MTFRTIKNAYFKPAASAVSTAPPQHPATTPGFSEKQRNVKSAALRLMFL